MAKVTINGEIFDFDGSSKPMSEALALEAALGMRYAEWETELAAGSAKALAAFAWLVLRRNGRDVALADILDGTADFDFGEFLGSLNEAPEGGADPTTPAASPAPDGTPTTATAT